MSASDSKTIEENGRSFVEACDSFCDLAQQFIALVHPPKTYWDHLSDEEPA